MIRRVLAVAVLGVALAACDDSPNAPSETVNFTAALSAANEVPPVTGAEAGASGTMNIALTVTRDSGGTITQATADFSGTFAGFPAGTSLTAAHIHTGVAGQNGGFQVNLGLSAGEITFPNGSGSLTKNDITVTAADAAQYIANPAAFYFNAHTAANPGGAVRGQLVKQ